MKDKDWQRVGYRIVLAVCREQNGLCMDVDWECKRLAKAITKALADAGDKTNIVI
jgi:hypothetical protein